MVFKKFSKNSKSDSWSFTSSKLPENLTENEKRMFVKFVRSVRSDLVK